MITEQMQLVNVIIYQCHQKTQGGGVQKMYYLNGPYI
jgi:hypothetical protein